MNDMTGCLHIRQTLGVYVLGAIDPAERAVVDAHLAGCPTCREELAGFAGLPALLGRVPVEEAERITRFDPERGMSGEQAGDLPLGADGTPAASELLDPLLARVAHQRRISRWRGLAAAAAVALIAAGTAIGALHVARGPSTSVAAHWQTVQMTDGATHTTAVVKYDSAPWGTRLEAQVSGIPVGTTCQFWVTGAGGQRWSAGSWTVASTWQDPWYQASSSAPIGRVRGFEITSGATVLVSMHAT